MQVIKNPGKRYYWQNATDMRNELVYNAMRRPRFETICRFLHFVDNNDIKADDKYWKLRPLTNLLKESFLKHYVPEQNMSYDGT